MIDVDTLTRLHGHEYTVVQMAVRDRTPDQEDDVARVGFIGNEFGDIWIGSITYCQFGVVSLAPHQAAPATVFGWQMVGMDDERVLMRRDEQERRRVVDAITTVRGLHDLEGRI